MQLISRVIPVVVLVAALGSAAAIGQTPRGAAGSPDASKAVVLGTGAFTAFVENMDRSLAFFHDAFGMEVPALPATGERPYNRANPQLFAMFDLNATLNWDHLITEAPSDTLGVNSVIFTALQEQLGFKLESTRAAVETIVIDSVQPATGN